MARPIDVPQIEEAAARVAASADFGDGLWRPALHALLDAIERDAAIEPVRWQRSALQFVSMLATRSRAAALLRAHPEIADTPLPSPVFIVGLPRTGTTLLHNALAGHPDLWAPPLWQLRSPVRLAHDDATWERIARAESENLLAILYQTIPVFRAIHPMRATGPDECSWLFRTSFATLVNAFTYRIPSYVDWITGADMTPYYRHYRSLLQILTWQRGGRARLVLKDPCHLWHLGPLLEVFPDATVLFLHRRLDQTLPSLASLCFALQRVESAHTDATTMAPYCLDLVERGLWPALFLRRALPAARVIDLRYDALARDLPAALATLCARTGLRGDDDAIAAMRRWPDENRQHQAGAHTYTLEQFGFHRDDLLARFRRYHDEQLPA